MSYGPNIGGSRPGDYGANLDSQEEDAGRDVWGADLAGPGVGGYGASLKILGELGRNAWGVNIAGPGGGGYGASIELTGPTGRNAWGVNIEGPGDGGYGPNIEPPEIADDTGKSVPPAFLQLDTTLNTPQLPFTATFAGYASWAVDGVVLPCPYTEPPIAGMVIPDLRIIECDGTYTPPDINNTDIEFVCEGPDAAVIQFTLQLPAPSPDLTAGIDAEAWHRTVLGTTNPAHIPESLTIVVAGGLVIEGAIAATMPIPNVPGLTGASGTVEQLLDLPDAEGARTTTQSQQMIRTTTGADVRTQEGISTSTPASAYTQQGMKRSNGLAIEQAQGLKMQRGHATPQQQALKLSRGIGYEHAEALQLQRRISNREAQALPMREGTGFDHAEAIRVRPGHRHEYNIHGRPTANPLSARYADQGLKTATPLAHPYAEMMDPAPGRWWPFYETPDLAHLIQVCDGQYEPRGWWCWQVLSTTNTPAPQPPCGPGPGEPPVDPDGPQFIIPTRRIYTVSNSASLVRVSDGLDIPASRAQIQIDTDNYTWTMSANVTGPQALTLLQNANGEPVEVDLMINGTTWRIAVDNWSASEAWQSRGGTVRGRSQAAYLASPYADQVDYQETQLRQAQQLANQELPFGWSLTWGIPDWTVPANAWQYQNLAPVDAIARIAKAGGGYVQADRTQKQLDIRPLYPQAPWDWDMLTADVAVPADVLIQRGSEAKPGQAKNAVYVHGGQNGGILALVKRSGSAGDKLARTIVDSLITNQAPARERGIAALSATRRQSLETYQLPLASSVGGLMEPGTIISSGQDNAGTWDETWRGIVRQTRVAATAGTQRGAPTLSVKQDIQIERSIETA